MAFGNVMREYGGDCYPQSRKVRRTKDHVYSFRCLDCQTLRYVTPRELQRAARPRCLRCGGPLEETKPSHRRHLERSDAIAVARGKASSDEPKQRIPVSGEVCECCGAKYDGGLGLSAQNALKFHVRGNAECAQVYAAGAVLTVTVKVEIGAACRIRAVLANGVLLGESVSFGRNPTEFTVKASRVAVHLVQLQVQHARREPLEVRSILRTWKEHARATQTLAPHHDYQSLAVALPELRCVD